MNGIYEVFLKYCTHEIKGRFSVLSLKQEGISPSDVKRIIDDVQSSCLAVLETRRSSNQCGSDSGDLAERLKKENLSARTIVIVNSSNEGIALDKQSPWGLLSENYYSPVGETYHQIALMQRGAFWVAIDVNFSRRINRKNPDQSISQIFVSYSKEGLKKLLEGRYHSDSLYEFDSESTPWHKVYSTPLPPGIKRFE